LAGPIWTNEVSFERARQAESIAGREKREVDPTIRDRDTDP